MVDNLSETVIPDAQAKPEATMGLRPTLFIGLGGTGMEVLIRVRRRILNARWSNSEGKSRIESLADFPIAQFIQFDLDHGAVIDSGHAQREDLQFDLVKFTDEEKIVESFDMDKYSRDDDALERYPHVKEWLSLTPRKIRELGIDPAKGAGQIRAISRLYFFDKYAKVRDKVRQKLKTLKAGLSHGRQLEKLGLKMEEGKFRVVVVASVAGGTGSGAFLDFGYLSRWLAKTEVGNADVELMLFLPTGYAKANKDRTEANAYAALMELESAMRGNKGYLGRWDVYDHPELPREPYSEVYLIDTGNMAQQHTKDVDDIYQMVADALFEDFASGDFARRKRSVAVNQAQHKNSLHDALVPKGRFGDMSLSYSKRYSAMGQAVLDTLQSTRKEEQTYRWAGEMLKAFFGVGGFDLDVNRATDAQRDEFMAKHLGLGRTIFKEIPEFSDKSIELKHSSGEFHEFGIVENLLRDRQGALLAGVEQRVNDRVDEIRNGFDRKEWSAQIRNTIKQMERDAVRDQDSTADTTEDRVVKRRRELLEEIKQTVRNQLYVYLDNKEYGGLEYVLSLVEQIKDRLEAGSSGVIASLKVNAERYREIKEAVRTRETERLLANLEQTKGGWFSGGEKQAVMILDQLRTEIANGIKFHLRAKAADEAATLMAEVSAWLGRRTGVDEQGAAIWNGLVGELQQGRRSVLDMLDQLNHANAVIEQELKKKHVTLIPIPAPLKDVRMPGVGQLREWAEEAFKDFGGSKNLFRMLGESEDRNKILIRVKRMAEQQLELVAPLEDKTQSSDPLYEALDQLTPAARQETFRKLLACAMPWIDANLSGDFTVRADQYKCFVGVANAEDFKRRFSNELEACIPTGAGITTAQLSVVETGIPGRAVCYTELSGVPLTVLRGLEVWRTSYRKESDEKKASPHTHIDSTQFSHPIAPSTEELNRLAEDFKHYLLAIMTGVLTRSTQRFVPPGQYLFAVSRGDNRRIGNERAIRQNGLPTAYRQEIVNRIHETILTLGKLQLAALSALAGYYESEVYTPKLVSDATGAENVRKGFASAIAEELKEELKVKARSKGLSEELGQTVNQLRDKLNTWAMPVPDSDEDAYDWEVREPEEDGKPRLKYVMKPEMLKPGTMESLLNDVAAPTPRTTLETEMGFNPMYPSSQGVRPPMMMTPPPLFEHQYHVAINGTQYGPYSAQQLVQLIAGGQARLSATKVWRPGLTQWVALEELASELGPLPQTVLQTPPPLV